jgi:hypothetical protein
VSSVLHTPVNSIMATRNGTTALTAMVDDGALESLRSYRRRDAWIGTRREQRTTTSSRGLEGYARACRRWKCLGLPGSEKLLLMTGLELTAVAWLVM